MADARPRGRPASAIKRVWKAGSTIATTNGPSARAVA
jgi:hypothetical protein